MARMVPCAHQTSHIYPLSRIFRDAPNGSSAASPQRHCMRLWVTAHRGNRGSVRSQRSASEQLRSIIAAKPSSVALPRHTRRPRVRAFDPVTAYEGGQTSRFVPLYALNNGDNDNRLSVRLTGPEWCRVSSGFHTSTEA